ncbi:MAG: glycosyltransferase [Pseudomonadota bacterium]|nr:glycosyltransferase [Pseudomonadota bacterium]
MKKISIIIPIYNVEKYLPKCLDSVINQTWKNIEIICVNDGSPDNSSAILESYAAKDPRIKIINRPNGGISAARNTGLTNATGDYIFSWIPMTI